jgi:aldehyde:ferredoxin oxidoreductase
MCFPMSEHRGGYTGRFLRVDLDRGALSVEETPDPATWLGPRGWNALIAYRELAPGVDVFDPENRLVLSSGPLVGTSAPTAGRMTISTISPRGYPGPMWTSASMGGYLGAECKYAGYDGIVIHGQASSPCYLLIEDDRVSLRDASDLWGLGTFETQRRLKERHGNWHQIAAIGPAGENRVRYASIIHRLSNAVGNGGFGGVMGAKGLKAIVVRGTGGVSLADPAAFLAEVERVWELTRGGISLTGQVDGGYPIVACSHGCSVRCGTRMAKVPRQLGDGPALRMAKCVNNSWVGGSHLGYEGTHINGQRLTIPHPPGLGDVGYDLGNLVEDLGLTSWFYDSWYRYFGGLREMGIHDAAGLELNLEDAGWWRDLVLQVAHRQGVGDDLAEGLARFYDKYQIGPSYLAEFVEGAGSRGHGWHREGRAMELHPSPFWEYSALLYAVSTRDVTPSTHGFFFLNDIFGIPKGPSEPGPAYEAIYRLAERLYGTREAVLPGMDVTERVVAYHQHRAVIKDSLGLCDWVFPAVRRTFPDRDAMVAAMRDDPDSVVGDPGAEAALYHACTGIDMPIEEMQRPVAERVVTLERCVEVTHFGRDRSQDEVVIPHYQWTEKTDGTHLSEDADEFRALLDRYYDLRGWDRESGAPTPETCARLGLNGALVGAPDA